MSVTLICQRTLAGCVVEHDEETVPGGVIDRVLL